MKSTCEQRPIFHSPMDDICNQNPCAVLRCLNGISGLIVVAARPLGGATGKLNSKVETQLNMIIIQQFTAMMSLRFTRKFTRRKQTEKAASYQNVTKKKSFPLTTMLALKG